MVYGLVCLPTQNTMLDVTSCSAFCSRGQPILNGQPCFKEEVRNGLWKPYYVAPSDCLVIDPNLFPSFFAGKTGL